MPKVFADLKQTVKPRVAKYWSLATGECIAVVSHCRNRAQPLDNKFGREVKQRVGTKDRIDSVLLACFLNCPTVHAPVILLSTNHASLSALDNVVRP